MLPIVPSAASLNPDAGNACLLLLSKVRSPSRANYPMSSGLAGEAGSLDRDGQRQCAGWRLVVSGEGSRAWGEGRRGLHSRMRGPRPALPSNGTSFRKSSLTAASTPSLASVTTRHHADNHHCSLHPQLLQQRTQQTPARQVGASSLPPGLGFCNSRV